MSGGYQMMPKKAYASYRLVGYMVSYGKPEPYTFTSYAAVGYILQARPLQIPRPRNYRAVLASPIDFREMDIVARHLCNIASR